MKVTLKSHGGLAAGLRRAPKVVDSATLSADEAEELARLVTAAEKAPLPAPGGSGTSFDSMGYTITVEDPSAGKEKMLEQSDTSMTAPFAELLEWLESRSDRD